MVASIATAATAAYYMESQQSYRHPNNYYIGGKEPDGRWWNPHGLFGLSDNENIDPREFHRIYSGLDPATSEKLTRLAGNDKRTAGFDLTFSPDKSVSALWAVADQDLRTKIEAAQQEAVRFTLDFIVRGYCSHTRIRHPDGQLEVVPGDLMAATFQHGSSRANDPQLHTHSVIFNLVKTHHDKKFRALHARPLFSWKMAAGSVYRTALAWNLQQSIGVKMEQYGRNQDLTRIAGMPDALIKEWSTRRNQIENFAQMLGFETGTNAARAAAINKLTRNAKDNDPDADGQFERWQAEARILVPELEQTIAAAIGRDITIGPEHHTSLEDVLAQLPEKLTSHEAVIALPLIVEKVANATASLTSPQVLQSYIDRVLSSQEMVRLDRPSPSPDANADLAHTHIFTTRHTIQVENDIHQLATLIATDPKHQINDQAIETKLTTLRQENYPLSQEQIDAIKYATTAGRSAIIEGAAGSGKTTTLKPITDLYRDAGYNVIGTAIPWRVAVALANDCNIQPQSLRRLMGLAQRGKIELNDKTVIIVDEAGMLSSRQVREPAPTLRATRPQNHLGRRHPTTTTTRRSRAWTTPCPRSHWQHPH